MQGGGAVGAAAGAVLPTSLPSSMSYIYSGYLAVYLYQIDIDRYDIYTERDKIKHSTNLPLFYFYLTF